MACHLRGAAIVAAERDGDDQEDGVDRGDGRELRPGGRRSRNGPS